MQKIASFLHMSLYNQLKLLIFVKTKHKTHMETLTIADKIAALEIPLHRTVT